ncbi:MAG TPA: FAD-dependent oxidoreductase [Xanthobacteraceae bacterium]|nr:FAD-dependent oxidoreductase [Xanthobacteraceae bacterium]
MAHDHDIVIAGGGIAGLTAALTAARLGRRTLVLTGDVLGGQLISIETIDGYPGFPDGVPGYDLCPIAQEQAAAAGAEFASTELTSIAPDGDNWKLTTGEGEITARGVIIATGAALKTLGVPGEERLHGKGVSHCATCDGPLLRNKVVAVAGGGDSGLQEALTLAQFASKVFVIERGAALSAQKIYRDRVAAEGKIEVRTNSAIEEILGGDAVSGVRIRDMSAGTTSDLEVGGVFVYIGLAPSAVVLKERVALDPSGAVPVDGLMRTELKGVCAAGTVRAGAVGRAASSAGDGAIAAVTLDRYLDDGRWRG